MKKFTGIPSGKLEYTSLPNLFFTELLPAVDDLGELRLTLHIFYLLSHKKGNPRFVTTAELRADRTLMNELGSDDVLTKGLAQAVERGTLLLHVNDGQNCYFFNTDESKRALAQIESGEVNARATNSPEPAEAPRPNIFELYEKHIGMLTPMIAEELKDAEKEYGERPEWIEDAFRIAVEMNKRNWKYVDAILKRWRDEGRDETTGRDPKKRSWYSQDEAKYFKR